jgi:predicted PurR-regulated permease PerM
MSLSILSITLSLIVLFLFIAFIRNTRDKITKLDEDLEKLSIELEKSINSIIREVNHNNDIIVNRQNNLNL